MNTETQTVAHNISNSCFTDTLETTIGYETNIIIFIENKTIAL